MQITNYSILVRTIVNNRPLLEWHQLLRPENDGLTELMYRDLIKHKYPGILRITTCPGEIEDLELWKLPAPGDNYV